MLDAIVTNHSGQEGERGGTHWHSLRWKGVPTSTVLEYVLKSMRREGLRKQTSCNNVPALRSYRGLVKIELVT